LDKVEAGAQGEHKIQRGYLPVATYSCHYIVDETFRKAIEDFLARETVQVLILHGDNFLLKNFGVFMKFRFSNSLPASFIALFSKKWLSPVMAGKC